MHDEKTIERFIELRSQGWFTSPVREIPDDEYQDQVQDPDSSFTVRPAELR